MPCVVACVPSRSAPPALLRAEDLHESIKSKSIPGVFLTMLHSRRERYTSRVRFCVAHRWSFSCAVLRRVALLRLARSKHLLRPSSPPSRPIRHSSLVTRRPSVCPSVSLLRYPLYSSRHVSPFPALTSRIARVHQQHATTTDYDGAAAGAYTARAFPANTASRSSCSVPSSANDSRASSYHSAALSGWGAADAGDEPKTMRS